jgi:hypothetical protein
MKLYTITNEGDGYHRILSRVTGDQWMARDGTARRAKDQQDAIINAVRAKRLRKMMDEIDADIARQGTK